MALQSESTQPPREHNSHLASRYSLLFELISSAITQIEPQKVLTVTDWVSFMSQNILGWLANACVCVWWEGQIRVRQ